MLKIYDLRYQMELRGGGDVWRLYGKCPEHPNSSHGDICPSTPTSFDEANDVLTTASGRKYKVVSYWDRTKVVEQIKKDIANGGYDVH